MKTLEVRRHSLTKKGTAREHGSLLSADGVQMARSVGEPLPDFVYVLTGPDHRHVETAIAMSYAVNETVEWTSGYASGVVAHHDQWRWDLVECGAQEFDPDVYIQAGELLARFHGQRAVIDDGVFEVQQKQKALAWLGRPHRIAADIAEQLTEEVRSWPTPPSAIVPTHGDWQPRKWLIHDGRVGVIDFGRAELRPAHTDF